MLRRALGAAVLLVVAAALAAMSVWDALVGLGEDDPWQPG